MAKKRTQKSRIIQYMRETGGITAWEAFKEIGCTQLGTRLFELEDLGWIFHRETVNTKNRWGEPCHFTRYSIKEEGISI